MRSPGNCFFLTAVALLAWLPVLSFAAEGEPESAAAQRLAALVEQDEGLAKRLEKLDLDLAQAVAHEAQILRQTISRNVPFWRENGLLGDEMREYQRLYGLVLDLHAAEGTDFSRCHGLFRILRTRVSALDVVYTGKISSGTHSERSAKERAEREGLMHSLMAVYLGALAAPTPEQGCAELRRFAQVINQLADVNVELIEREVDRLLIEERKFLWSLIPVAGAAMGLAESYQGTDIWGKKLSVVDHALNIIGAIGEVGDIKGFITLFKNLPTESVDVLLNLGKWARKIPDSELMMIERVFPPGAADALANFGRTFDGAMADLGGNALSLGGKALGKGDEVADLIASGRDLKRLPTISADEFGRIADKANPEGMDIARLSGIEQQEAANVLSKIPADEFPLSTNSGFRQFPAPARRGIPGTLDASWASISRDRYARRAYRPLKNRRRQAIPSSLACRSGPGSLAARASATRGSGVAAHAVCPLPVRVAPGAG